MNEDKLNKSVQFDQTSLQTPPFLCCEEFLGQQTLCSLYNIPNGYFGISQNNIKTSIKEMKEDGYIGRDKPQLRQKLETMNYFFLSRTGMLHFSARLILPVKVIQRRVQIRVSCETQRSAGTDEERVCLWPAVSEHTSIQMLSA